MAPVPANEALLNPLQPVRTGFIPTRPGQGQQQSGFGMAPQQTGYGMQPQQTGMMPQQTGYAAGFQQGYGGQPQQIQPSKSRVRRVRERKSGKAAEVSPGVVGDEWMALEHSMVRR